MSDHDGTSQDPFAAERAIAREIMAEWEAGTLDPEVAAEKESVRDPDPIEQNSLDVPEFSDIDLADRFGALHGEDVRYVDTWGKWLVWDDNAGRWRLDPNKARATALVRDVAASLYEEAAGATSINPDLANRLGRAAMTAATAARHRAILELARSAVLIEADALDADGWLFGVANGYIDLRDCTFHEPDRDLLITRHSSVAYDPDATAARWEQTMKEWLPGDGLVEYVQRLCGEAMVGAVRDHVLVVHYGEGANGKTTFVDVLRNVFGEYFATPHKSLLVQERWDQHDTVYADLFRIRLAVATETERRQKLSESKVKNLTGGDPVKARRMREDYWEFDPTHSLWLLTNYLPEVQGRDEGIWRRLRVVPWTERFDDDRRIRTLADELKQEAPGVLNWLLDGVKAYQDQGLTEPEPVKRATLDYREKEDTLGRFAHDVGLEFAQGLTVPYRELNNALQRWAVDEGVEPPGGNEVATWLKANGATKKRQGSSKTTTYHGVGFTTLFDEGGAELASPGRSGRGSPSSYTETHLPEADPEKHVPVVQFGDTPNSTGPYEHIFDFTGEEPTYTRRPR